MPEKPESAVEQFEEYGREVTVFHEHPEYGPLQGWCSRCGSARYRHEPGQMCADCVRETPGTDECSICREYEERICGYHSSSLWYCVDCGMLRVIGNRPARPGSDETVHCPLDPSDVFEEDQHEMVRLVYRSLAGENLNRYHKQQSRRWNEHTKKTDGLVADGGVGQSGPTVLQPGQGGRQKRCEWCSQRRSQCICDSPSYIMMEQCNDCRRWRDVDKLHVPQDADDEHVVCSDHCALTDGGAPQDAAVSSHNLDPNRLAGREYEVELHYTVTYRQRVIAGPTDADAVDEAVLIAFPSGPTDPRDWDLVHSDVESVRDVYMDDIDAPKAAEFIDEPCVPSGDSYWDDTKHFGGQNV